MYVESWNLLIESFVGVRSTSVTCVAYPKLTPPRFTNSNRLLTSGWWAYARKPVSSDILLARTPFGSLMHCGPQELHSRLGPVPYMGPRRGQRVPHSIFLFSVLHLCPHS